MNLKFNKKLATDYNSTTQKVRVMSEAWVLENAYCPVSGEKLDNYKNNQPVADFYCKSDNEDFELKAKKKSFGNKLVDGSYEKMIERLTSYQNPNLFLLTYQPKNYVVKNFFLVPKHFFIPRIIEKRNPLADTARRAGWVGCNILLTEIPRSGFISYVQEGIVQSKEKVLKEWRKTLFLRDESDTDLKGWLLEIMKCIDTLNKKEFTLQELYKFKEQLSVKYPKNKHIKAKIRQQLQFLRDRGYLKFVERGVYQLTN